MDYDVIDRVKGYTLDAGDTIIYDGNVWEIRPGVVDDTDPNILMFPAHNLDTGDEDEIPVEPEDYYELVSQ